MFYMYLEPCGIAVKEFNPNFSCKMSTSKENRFGFVFTTKITKEKENKFYNLGDLRGVHTFLFSKRALDIAVRLHKKRKVHQMIRSLPFLKCLTV
jgi:hypothetical protein